MGALGFQSIGDAATGYEHYINYSYIGDDKFLDPTAPESLVYRVDGDQRTLVSAMYIANGVAIDDPSIVGYGGPLMQWHVHLDLCWTGGSDGPKVVGVRDADGNCPPGSVNAGGGNPMVHVWIAPNPCGPFAALEGHGAGQTTDDATRTDQCSSGHDHGADGSTTADGVATSEHDHGDAAATAVAVPYTATLPVDLSGTPGVSAEQQAFAENLVTDTLERLPQWSDPAVAEAAGFRSIGDERHAATSTSSSGTGSTTTSSSIPTTRRASCTSRSRTGRAGSCRRCTCSRSRTRSTTCRTGAVR